MLSYFPEYVNEFFKIDKALLNFINKIITEVDELMIYKHLNRKEFSEHCLKTTIPMLGFKFYENNYIDINKFVRNIEASKLIKLIEEQIPELE